jgi:hypothetical protein
MDLVFVLNHAGYVFVFWVIWKLLDVFCMVLGLDRLVQKALDRLPKEGKEPEPFPFQKLESHEKELSDRIDRVYHLVYKLIPPSISLNDFRATNSMNGFRSTSVKRTKKWATKKYDPIPFADEIVNKKKPKATKTIEMPKPVEVYDLDESKISA